MKHLAYLNKYLLKYKYHLILGTLFIIISNVFAIVPAQVVRYSFDLVKETIDLYFLYDSYEAQQELFSVFATSIFMYGVVILIMALLKGFFLFLMRPVLFFVGVIYINFTFVFLPFSSSVYHNFVYFYVILAFIWAFRFVFERNSERGSGEGKGVRRKEAGRTFYSLSGISSYPSNRRYMFPPITINFLKYVPSFWCSHRENKD